MIKYDGYYVFKPFPFLDKKEENIIEFSLRGFLFQEDNLVISAQKWTKDENDINFSIEDFDLKNNPEKFEIINTGFYILSYEGKVWEEKFYYDKVSDEKFVSRQTREYIKFVPWRKNE